MTLKKYKVTSVSGNSQYAGQGSGGGDHVANGILAEAGFVDREGRSDNFNLFIGCEPMKGKTFFVYYAEPISDSEEGSFRLVRIESDGKEKVIDRGTASKSHTDPGVFTFYARGADLQSWSFHCDPNPVGEELVSKTPKIFVIQTSGGRRECEDALTRLGLKEDSDFRFLSFGDDLKKFIMGDKAKLLIIGSNHGQTDFIPRLVAGLKQENPKLIVLGYSSYNLPGVDVMIQGGVTYERSIDSIQTSVQYYTVPGYSVMGWKTRTAWV